MANLAFKLFHRFQKRRAQGVIVCFRKHIGSRRDEMRTDVKCRAGVGPSLDDDACFVDHEAVLERFELTRDQRGKGWRWAMMDLVQREFHDADIYGARFSI